MWSDILRTDQEEIVLGDVITSQALVQYDFGWQYPGGFKRKKDIRSGNTMMKSGQYRDHVMAPKFEAPHKAY